MKKKYRHASKVRKKFTFMIVPNSTGKIRQFTISYRTLASLVSGSIATVLVLGFFSSQFFYSSQNLNSVSKELAALKDENISQKNQITYFLSKSQEVEDRIERLSELERKVLEIVNIGGGNEEEVSSLVSRSDYRDFSIWDMDQVDIDYIDNIISGQSEDIESLISGIENQLQTLEAIPNLRPAPGRISSPFGERISPVTRRTEFHRGIDIANSTNTDIIASAAGVVTFSGYNGSYGNMVLIAHGNGYSTIYAHNHENKVEVGDRVQKGELIAKMGSTGRSTGPHVHFEIRKGGEPIDPKSMLEK